MTQTEAPIPRNTCPLCWQPTRVPLLQFLPSRPRELGFPCSSCNERIQVARSTQLVAYFGGLLVFGAIVAAVFALAPAGSLRSKDSAWGLVPFGLAALSVAFPVFAMPFARLALRLEPWVDGTL